MGGKCIMLEELEEQGEDEEVRLHSSSPPFYGFENLLQYDEEECGKEGERIALEEDLLTELELEATTEKETSMEEQASMRKVRGRPKGKGRSQVDFLTEGQMGPTSTSRRLLPYTPSNWEPRDKRTPGVSPRPNLHGSTSSRPSYYLVGRTPTSLTYSKLPKTGLVLGRFLELQTHHSKAQAARLVTKELSNVWLHHFGPRLILGKNYEKKQDDHGILIHDDYYIAKKITNLAEQWMRLEQDSRRSDRSAGIIFQQKEKQMLMDLDMPFNISRKDAENIIKSAGILDWREEAAYLQGQLKKDQVGCVSSWDTRQQKRDERRLKEELSTSTAMAKEKRIREEQLKSSACEEQEQEEQDEENDTEDDEDYCDSVVGSTRRKKIDIMGKISQTCDARNISLRDRTMVAASVINALGIDIEDTNISKSTAWKQGRKVRLAKAEEIKDKFVCPEKVVSHWDGKTLTLRGQVESKSVAIYLSGVDTEQTRKLLGIPECVSGKGKDEFELTQEISHSMGCEEAACRDGFRHNSVKQWRAHWSVQVQYSAVQYSAVKLSTVQYQTTRPKYLFLMGFNHCLLY